MYLVMIELIMASSVTFVKPTEHPFMNELQYQQNDTSVKWNKTYWGRMINWDNSFNQVEQVIKRLKENIRIVKLYHEYI